MELFGKLPLEDLEELGNLTRELIRENRYTNFIVVGASGFLGRWLATYFAFMRINAEFLGTLSLLVRNSDKMAEFRDMPQSALQMLIEVDGVNSESFRHLNTDRVVVFFAASSTSSATKKKEDTSSNALQVAETIFKHLPKQAITFVHLSSGGVYELGARQLQAVPKNYKTQADSDNPYISEKISLERWSTSLSLTGHLTAKNPRLFSFYGPGLQLDRHFAIGEFMEKGRRGLPIEIVGNPSNRRSYLHPRDAVWQLLLQCKSDDPIYTQIGSYNAITVSDAGKLIADLHGVDFRVLPRNGTLIDHYVPSDVPKAVEKDFEHGLRQWSHWLNKGLLS